jgi:hypothetical protein
MSLLQRDVHQSLAIDSGAYFEGRSVQARGADGQHLESKNLPREIANASKAA